MKIIPIMATAAILLASAETGLAQSMKQITTKEEFVSLIKGRTSYGENGNSTWTADGKFQGIAKSGDKFHGVWAWHGPYLCINFVIRGKETGTNCGTYYSDGSNTLFVRDQGKGRESRGVFR